MASDMGNSKCGIDVPAVVSVGSGPGGSVHVTTWWDPVPFSTLGHTSDISYMSGGGDNAANATSADPCGHDIHGETMASGTGVSVTPVSIEMSSVGWLGWWSCNRAYDTCWVGDCYVSTSAAVMWATSFTLSAAGSHTPSCGYNVLGGGPAVGSAALTVSAT